MKKFYTLFLAFTAVAAFAQIPAGYYNTATGTGYTLKTQLHNIIDDHTDRGYAGLYTTYTTSDKDFYYENNGTLLDMYSENPTGPDAYEYEYGSSQQDDGTLGTAEGQRFNREHIVPQSYFSSNLPMYADAHFIVPTDKYVNGQRGNFPFSKVGTATLTTSNGSKKGSNLNSGYSAGYTGTVFEPIDEFKGDIARMILYFATRYEGQLAGFYTSTNVSSTQSKAMFDGTEGHAFSNTFLNVLLTWHEQDPVSQREIDRNNAIYVRQRNRNPYIDHPEYVAQIWGSVAGVKDVLTSALSVYPNPAVNNKVNIYSESVLDEIQLINSNGQSIQRIQKPQSASSTYTLEQLSQGFYLLKATSGNQTITKKILVN
ncbi:T9SS type A sorting domain-containing protein [Flavobacterium sp. Sd200]|uniref:endonuclease n=1 Tax=Flavobacterium sp. Sd200 TaxID=2692211 RepID=UPI001370A3E1|nr:endonuclease [Flavobacterium sp. Sd200]MXN90107.1 T9SS type A sorting domain-containing protein [Flavobacterium sp. Sd200]